MRGHWVVVALLVAAASTSLAAATFAPIKSYNQLPRLIDEATVSPLGRAAKEKALILAFYSLDCGPCQGELKELVPLAERPGVELWIVALITERDEATGRCRGIDALKAKFEGHPLAPRVLVDNCANLTKRIVGRGLDALPVTVVYDPRGAVAQAQEGRPPGKTVEEALDAVLSRLGSRR